MRLVIALCLFAACGGSPAKPVAAMPRAPEKHSTVRPPPTPRDMLRALPSGAHMLVAFDVAKLRQSALATRAWAQVSELPRVTKALDNLCGLPGDVTYAMFAMPDFADHEMWGWLKGLRRDSNRTCSDSAKQKLADKQLVRHGDYSVVTSPKSVLETLWTDANTGFAFHHPKDRSAAGEAQLRHVIEAGGGLASDAAMNALLDHLDFDSGAWLVINGSLAKQPGIAGMAMSLEADDQLRAQIYVLFDNDDRASALQSKYRPLLAKLLKGHLIESGEARADGRGIAVSITVTGAQFDWWVAYGIATHNDPNATPPPLPTVLPPS